MGGVAGCAQILGMDGYGPDLDAQSSDVDEASVDLDAEYVEAESTDTGRHDLEVPEAAASKP